VPASAAVEDGDVYVGSSDGFFVNAVEAASGKEKWRFATPRAVFSSPALAAGVLYFGTGDCYDLRAPGSFHALDAATGRELWKLEVPAAVWSSPLVADGTVYFGASDGRLYAVR
jgi:outer membrane protein assembly factor BamB